MSSIMENQMKNEENDMETTKSGFKLFLFLDTFCRLHRSGSKGLSIWGLGA